MIFKGLDIWSCRTYCYNVHLYHFAKGRKDSGQELLLAWTGWCGFILIKKSSCSYFKVGEVSSAIGMSEEMTKKDLKFDVVAYYVLGNGLLD
uniref:Uncharacterized protein n=1 Tax=Lactuca sativa TaxID=4236 RepID=A0A9R1XMV2_LACSA|nr:hypothetical protein LSAT_V11C300114550 [Lactuca sativa]